jgi:hypothetical protein
MLARCPRREEGKEGRKEKERPTNKQTNKHKEEPHTNQRKKEEREKGGKTQR